MGNFHCIPNKCARVVWQPYVKASGIRYRYPGEDWVYVDGDDYKITVTHDCQTNDNYYAFVTFTCNVTDPVTGSTLPGWSNNDTQAIIFFNFQSIPDFGKKNFEFLYTENGRAYAIKRIPFVKYTYPFNSRQRSNGDCSTLNSLEGAAPPKSPVFFEPPVLNNIQWGIQDYSGSYENVRQFLTFKLEVYKEGITVLIDSGNDKPEVEILGQEDGQKGGCQLSETHQEIIIDKLAWFERVEIRDKLIEVEYFGGLPLLYARDIPDNYLIIYKALITAPIGLNDFVPSPGFIFPWEIIGYIASEPDCPAPEYTVYCDCDCESCPDGTCAVECGDHICCNDPNTGKNITSIPKENYCKNEYLR